MIFINHSTMSSIEAPQFTISTPFTLDETLLTGFDYELTTMEYIRCATGSKLTPSAAPMPERFHAYNDAITKISPDVNIKLLSLNEIEVTSGVTREFLSFLVTINRYTITPKETLSAEQEWRFCNKICELLESIHDHPMKSFFTTDSLMNTKRTDNSITLNNKRIALPNIYIHVDETFTDEDELKVVQYIDKCNAFYREQFNAILNEEEEGIEWDSVVDEEEDCI